MSDVTGGWLLVEWDDESREVVNMRSWIDTDQEMKVGDELNFSRRNSVTRRGKLLAVSDDRKYLLEQLVKMLKNEQSHLLGDQHDIQPEIFNGNRPGTPIVYRSAKSICKTETSNRLESPSWHKPETINGHRAETPNKNLSVMSKSFKSETPNGCIILEPNNGYTISDTSNLLRPESSNGSGTKTSIEYRLDAEQTQKKETFNRSRSQTPNGSRSEKSNGYKSETEKKLNILCDSRTQTPNGPRSQTPNVCKSKTEKTLKTPSGSRSATPNGSRPEIEKNQKPIPDGSISEISIDMVRSEALNKSKSLSDREMEFKTNTLNKCILDTPNGVIPGTLKRLRSESLNSLSSQSLNSVSPKQHESLKFNGKIFHTLKSGMSAKGYKAKISDGKKFEKRKECKTNPGKKLKLAPELDADPEPGEDYSSSGSSWGPEEQDFSDSDDEVVVPTKKVRRDSAKSNKNTFLTNNCKRMTSNRTPSLRAKAVIPHRIWNSRERKNSEGFVKVTKAQKTNSLSKRYSKIYSKYVKLKKNQKDYALKTKKTLEELGGSIQALTVIIEKSIGKEIPLLNPLDILLFAGLHIENSANNLSPSVLLDEHNYCAASNFTNISENNQHIQDVEMQTLDTSENLSQQPKSPTQIPELNSIELPLKEDKNTSASPTPPDTSVPETNGPNAASTKSYRKKNNRSSKSKTKPKKYVSAPYASCYLHEAEDTQDGEMIALGSGKTMVRKELYDTIDWRTHTMATRKLLSFVFPRSVLGSHSLTGRKSAAFADKPAKLCLNQRKVNDIVMTVVRKCKVKPNLVRSAITTKCADEYKRAQALKKAAALTLLEVQNKGNILRPSNQRLPTRKTNVYLQQ